MTLVFLALLAVAWIVVFLPAALRARENTPLSAAERFKRRMSLIAPRRQRGRYVVVPESSARLSEASFKRGQRVRKNILVFLIVAAVLSGVAAIVLGDGLWEVHLAFDTSLGLYCVLLIEAKRRRRETRSKVRPLRVSPRRAVVQRGAHAGEARRG